METRVIFFGYIFCMALSTAMYRHSYMSCVVSRGIFDTPGCPAVPVVSSYLSHNITRV
jgi:hypothetical protein